MGIHRRCSFKPENEIYEILDGETLLIEKHLYAPAEEKTFFFCIKATYNYQYTVKLKHKKRNSWRGGSFVAFLGPEGNESLHATMTNQGVSAEVFQLSLYTPIQKSDQLRPPEIPESWLFLNWEQENWTHAQLDTKAWTPVVLPSPVTAAFPNITHYFRKTYMSIDGVRSLAALELRLWYKAGIIAHINGHEVYRDNLPSGHITESTPASRAYPDHEEHGIIRTTHVLNDKTKNVLAVEIHHLEGTQKINFNCWMSVYASSFPQSLSDTGNCYTPSKPDMIVATEGGSDIDKIFDLSPATGWLLADAPEWSVDYEYHSSMVQVNGYEIEGGTYGLWTPSEYIVSAAEDFDDPAYIALDYRTNQKFSKYSRFVFTIPISTQLYSHVRISNDWSSQSVVYIAEFHPLVCKLDYPESFRLIPDDIEAVPYVDHIHIKPELVGIQECSTIVPELPAGLTLDTTFCTVNGTATEEKPFATYSLFSASHNLTGTFNMSVEYCRGPQLCVIRHYGYDPSGLTISIQKNHLSSSQGDIVFEENLYDDVNANDSIETYICIHNSDNLKLTMGSELSRTWSPNTQVEIREYLISTAFTERFFFSRFELNAEIPSRMDFGLFRPLRYGSEWAYATGYLDDDWFSCDTSEWEVGTSGSFNFSSAVPSPIHIFRSTFDADMFHVNNSASIVFSIRYKEGVVVMFNGEEIYRNNVSDDIELKNIRCSRVFESDIYRMITYPVKSMASEGQPHIYNIHEHNNQIAVAIVGRDDQSKPIEFDLTIRLDGSDKNDRTIDITTNNENLSDKSAATGHFHLTGKFNHSVTFNDDRREWISSITIVRFNIGDGPTKFCLKAKNRRDFEYTTLMCYANISWAIPHSSRTFFFQNSKSYNQYYIDSVPESMWSMSDVIFYSNVIPIVSPPIGYPASVTLYLGVEAPFVYPQCNDFRFGFRSDPPFPAGVIVDSLTGIIYGKPKVVAPEAVYTISCDGANLFGASTTIRITVVSCDPPSSVVTVNTFTDTYPEKAGFMLCEGTENCDVVRLQMMGYSRPNIEQNFDICLEPNFYNLQIISPYEGSKFSSGVRVLIESDSVKPLPLAHALLPSISETSTRDKLVFYSYTPLQSRSSNYSMYLGTLPVNKEWFKLSFVESTDWKVMHPSEFDNPQAAKIVYLRKLFRIDGLVDLSIMHVQVKYRGKIAGYFNGVRVLRVNITDIGSDSFSPPTARDSLSVSRFHIVLSSQGAVEGNNCLAFEVHSPYSKGTVFEFEGLAVFGIDTCNIIYDKMFLTPEPTQEVPFYLNYTHLFDFNIFTYFSVQSGMTSSYSVLFENQEIVRFNALAIISGGQCDVASRIVNGRTYSDDEELEVIESVSSLVDRNLTIIDVPIGLLGFSQLDIELRQSCHHYHQLSELIPMYCVHSKRVCPAVGSFPSVSEGQESPSSCGPDYDGYSYRLCKNGELQEENRSKCTEKTPYDFMYNTTAIEFIVGVHMRSILPDAKGIIWKYELREPETSLPFGIQLDPVTGMFYGCAQNFSTPMNFTVYAVNSCCRAKTTVEIIARLAECESLVSKSIKYQGDIEVVYCSKRGLYHGSIQYECMVNDSIEGRWEQVGGYCISYVLAAFVLSAVVVFIFLSALLMHERYRHRKKSHVLAHKYRVFLPKLVNEKRTLSIPLIDKPRKQRKKPSSVRPSMGARSKELHSFGASAPATVMVPIPASAPSSSSSLLSAAAAAASAPSSKSAATGSSSKSVASSSSSSKAAGSSSSKASASASVSATSAPNNQRHAYPFSTSRYDTRRRFSETEHHTKGMQSYQGGRSVVNMGGMFSYNQRDRTQHSDSMFD